MGNILHNAQYKSLTCNFSGKSRQQGGPLYTGFLKCSSKNAATRVMPACPQVVTYLPTIMSSHSDARDLKVIHRSMVKMVLALLKMEVREDMRAAIITAIIKPRSPGRENTERDWHKRDSIIIVIISSMYLERAKGRTGGVTRGKSVSPAGSSSITSLA